MNTNETLTTFIEFFRERGHRRIVGSSLVPPLGDPVLFTTSGMHPLTPTWKGAHVRWAGGWSTYSAAYAPPISTRSATAGI